MRRYRKKPIEIEATLWNPLDPKSAGWVVGWMMVGSAHFTVNEDKTLSIHTLEGEMNCNIGDWIIKGVQGEFYPCKPDIFEVTYEEVE